MARNPFTVFGSDESRPEWAAAAARLARALSFHRAGQLDRAEPLYREVLSRFPGHFDALHLCGVLEGQRNNPAASVELIRRAIAIRPDEPDAHTNLGNALRCLKRPFEALAAYEQALKIRPGHPETLLNRGTAFQDLGRHQEAVASYDQALAANPGLSEAHYNRGNALRSLGLLDLALASYSRAIAIQPRYLNAIMNRGNALCDLKRYKEAIAEFKRVLAIDPHVNYGRATLLNAQLQCCEWTDYDSSAAEIVTAVRNGERAGLPIQFQWISQSTADQLQCARTFIAHRYPAAETPIWGGDRYRHDRIRLAYLSADFREHPASYLLAGMFELFDRSRFETIALSFGPDDQSEVRTRLQNAFERFIDVRDKSDLEVGQLMRDLEIDIAVDLMGHTEYQRTGIFALRPAPIQVNFFCPGTSGADYLDYIVCDRVVIPEEHRAHYSEKVVYLPDTFQANDSKRRIADRTPSRAEAGLPEKGVVFCAFNNTYKYAPPTFNIWMRLLHQVEGSVLWLQHYNVTATDNLRREAVKRDIDADRLIFAPRVPRLEDHLARYRLADLFLDTLPYNAQTTASDALWAGLPVLTCLGGAFSGRVAASLLNAIGLPDLITHSLEQYEALAFKLATDRGLLASVRDRLARNRTTHPLFDTDRFRRHLELAYIMMWERYQCGEPPVAFSVSRVS